MKILVVSTSPWLRNGIIAVIKNMFFAMNHDGIRIDVLMGGKPEESFRSEVESRGGRFITLERSLRHPVRYVAALTRIIREEQYDVVHAHGNSCTLALEMYAAALAGCKARIAHSHNTTCKCMAIHNVLKPLFHRLCNVRLACGDEAGRWLHGDRHFLVIRNGIDVEKFAFSPKARRAVRQKYGLMENQRVIGHVGRFNEAKNQKFLVEILKVLVEQGMDYRLMLVGDGELRHVVENQVESAGLTDFVFFVGETEQVMDYLSACDLLVMPSFFEGLPLTLVEAQANGLPCIISSSITKDVNMTGNISYLPLTSGAELWADHIQKLCLPENRENTSKLASQSIRNNGYDIYMEAQRLKGIYMNVGDRSEGNW